MKLRNDTDITVEVGESVWIDFDDPRLSSISIHVSSITGAIKAFPREHEMDDGLGISVASTNEEIGVDLFSLNEDAKKYIDYIDSQSKPPI